jgi:hypothetical protein
VSGVHIAVRFYDIVQLIGSINHRFEFARLKQIREQAQIV